MKVASSTATRPSWVSRYPSTDRERASRRLAASKIGTISLSWRFRTVTSASPGTSAPPSWVTTLFTSTMSRPSAPKESKVVCGFTCATRCTYLRRTRRSELLFEKIRERVTGRSSGGICSNTIRKSNKPSPARSSLSATMELLIDGGFTRCLARLYNLDVRTCETCCMMLFLTSEPIWVAKSERKRRILSATALVPCGSLPPSSFCSLP
ncbi:hypothetical protein CSUI_010006 [Cystoisospora suis]|uniref:Uncharacterized protein n=1 Tax=Cystoisospora suis TaxID=483139 RepID=A0A2C6KIG7_9APIC|nr:hypothetical protein CSUI_010006 [Cystoisospora suis]